MDPEAAQERPFHKKGAAKKKKNTKPKTTKKLNPKPKLEKDFWAMTRVKGELRAILQLN